MHRLHLLWTEKKTSGVFQQTQRLESRTKEKESYVEKDRIANLIQLN